MRDPLQLTESWRPFRSSLMRLINSTLKTVAEIVAAPKARLAHEWAEAERILPPGTPIPGNVSYRNTPYLIFPGELLQQPKCASLTVILGAQMGKSFFCENIIGHKMDDDPCPIIYYAPTESNIVKKVEPIMVKMIRESYSLMRKFSESSTQFRKVVGGAILYLSFLGSATETAATSARLIIVDELDRCARNSEGRVDQLAEARGGAYADSKLLMVATSTRGIVPKFTDDEGLQRWEVVGRDQLDSAIWQRWQKGTRHEWAVPCPHCGEYFIPWSELLWWPEKDRVADAECTESQARLICPANGCQIEDKYRRTMNQRGTYLAPGQSVKDGIKVGYEPKNKHASVWASGLCSFSPKKSYGFLAAKLHDALKDADPDALMAIYNTDFGECYSPLAQNLQWESVKDRCWHYEYSEVYGQFKAIFATVDVQKDRFVYVVRAWFPGMGSQLIDEGEIIAETAKSQSWAELDTLLDAEYDGYPVNLMGIDCGYQTDEVFNYCRNNRGRTIALRGDDIRNLYRRMTLESNYKGKKLRGGDVRWDFSSSQAKTWVHSRLNRDPSEQGFFLLPKNISDQYCKELTAEQQTLTGDWQNVRKDNHRLDCEAMQFVLARIKGINRLKNVVSVNALSRIEPEARTVKTVNAADLGRRMGNGDA